MVDVFKAVAAGDDVIVAAARMQFQKASLSGCLQFDEYNAPSNVSQPARTPSPLGHLQLAFKPIYLIRSDKISGTNSTCKLQLSHMELLLATHGSIAAMHTTSGAI